MRHITRALTGVVLAAGVLTSAACSDDDAGSGPSDPGSAVGNGPGEGEGQGALLLEDFSCEQLDPAALGATSGLQLDAVDEQGLGGGITCFFPDVNADPISGNPELAVTVREPLVGRDEPAAEDRVSDVGDEAWWISVLDDRELVAQAGGIELQVNIYDFERDETIVDDATVETTREALDQVLR